jgi:transcriptional regulator with XRE-family HTH domain
MAKVTLPNEPIQDGKSTTAHPGSILKALRAERGWTLAQVSELTGLPITTLSKIENEKLSLSYDKLVRISKGLGIDISRFFGMAEAPKEPAGITPSGRRSFTRAGDGSVIETRNYRHIFPAADLLNKQFTPVIAELRIHSRADFGPLIRHAGEEYAIVLEGRVEFHTELYAPMMLNKGDSIYFDSSMGHAYIAADKGPCRILSICSDSEVAGTLRAEDSPEPAKPPTILRSA